ncbi:MAG: hypothetical protein JWM36_610 [Hyphomicrobiales bacterium]|nr:hypothetical protein [Hyphomicrobiales bacterium]
MTDKAHNQPADPARVNVNETHEVRYWTKALACSQTELRTAVGEVGTSTPQVKEYLAKHRKK